MSKEDKRTVTLTARHWAFVRAYAKSGNATQAATEAGYSPDTARQQGSRLLSKASIRSALKKRAEAAGVKAQDILTAMAETALGGSPDEEPNPVRLRAQELVGKHLGMFVERHEVVDARTPLEGLTSAELANALAELVARARRSVPAEKTPVMLPAAENPLENAENPAPLEAGGAGEVENP